MADVLDSRAIVYIARKEYDKALEDLAAAVQDDKGSPEKRFHQAWAYSLAGKKTEASEAFAAADKIGLDAKKLDPREVLVYKRLRDEAVDLSLLLANWLAMRRASIMLLVSASRFQAMSKAVPWATLVRMIGRPSVTLTAWCMPNSFRAMCPWSWYMATTASNSPVPGTDHERVGG